LNEALLYKLRKYNLFSNGFKILRFRTLYKINLVKLKSYTKKLNSDSSFKSKYLFYKQKDEKLKNELDFLSKK
jgi:hypothetical protein